ncbi:MAG: hypothetical protein O2894_06525 [Planctomycetota bacterium]|nr:hypothetical protein [Planctomycetota bacterium]
MLPALALLGTLVAVGLMIAILIRQGGRTDALHAEVERMKVAQRDTATDVRARLEAGAETWAQVENEMRPRLAALEALEASVADLGASLDENLPALIEARTRLEAVEGRADDVEAQVAAKLGTDAFEAAARESEDRIQRVEQALRTLRDAADARLADLAARLSVVEAHAANAEPDAPELPRAAEPASPVGSSRGTGRSRRGRGPWVILALLLGAGLVAVVAALS